MQQLLMRRPNLENLPDAADLPAGYMLRDGHEEDIPRLATVLGAAFLNTDWTSEEAHKSLIADASVKRIFVIECDGALVATASSRLLPNVYPDSGYVHWVGVDPAHQGRRLGYSVTLATLTDFAARGCRDAVLETDDFRIPAIKTYLKLGFTPVYRDETHRERWDKINK